MNFFSKKTETREKRIFVAYEIGLILKAVQAFLEIVAGVLLYAINTKGECLVLATGDKFALLAKNELGEESRATPAIADGVLYLRTLSHLSAISSKPKM